jgi:hypothetical protein
MAERLKLDGGAEWIAAATAVPAFDEVEVGEYGAMAAVAPPLGVATVLANRVLREPPVV